MAEDTASENRPAPPATLKRRVSWVGDLALSQNLSDIDTRGGVGRRDAHVVAGENERFMTGSDNGLQKKRVSEKSNNVPDASQSLANFEQFGYPTHKDSTTAWVVYGNRYDGTNSPKDRMIGLIVIMFQVVTYALILANAVDTIKSDMIPVVISWSSCLATNAAGESMIAIEEVAKAPSDSPSDTPSAMPSESPTVVPSSDPSGSPSSSPSAKPSQWPSEFPSSRPTYEPTQTPTKLACNPIPSNCHRKGRRLCCADPKTNKAKCERFPKDHFCDDHDTDDHRQRPGRTSGVPPDRTPGVSNPGSDSQNSLEEDEELKEEETDGNRWSFGLQSATDEDAESTSMAQSVVINNTTKITVPPLQCEAKQGNILGWLFASALICFFLTADFQDSTNAVGKTFHTMLNGGSRVNFFMAILAYTEIAMAFTASVFSASSRIYVGELVDGIEAGVGMLFVHDIGGRIYVSLVGDRSRRYRAFFGHYVVLYALASVGGIALTYYF